MLIEANGQRTGERFFQPALATALTEIASGGSAAFYTGTVGRSIVAYLERGGGVLSEHDLAELRVVPLEPIRITYRGHEIVSHPPVSLGCVLLEELKILEGFAVDQLRGADLIDLLVASKWAAFADAATLGDPAERDNQVEWLLSARHAAYWRERLGGQHERQAVVAGGTDTTSAVVADDRGNVVTLIQSLFNEFGSRELVPECGVLLNDRLANLAVDGSLPNGLRGGRKPLHTLSTYMVLEDGEPVLAGATPGGRGQVQINLQMLVNVLDLGMDVQAAINQPRWISGLPYRGEHDQTLYLEPAFAADTADALRSRGHQVQIGVEPRAQADPFGNCTVIARSIRNRTLQGAADTRRDACAIGW
jgi:gamma-glutamyltranspeptidase/glutathione hydrolase